MTFFFCDKLHNKEKDMKLIYISSTKSRIFNFIYSTLSIIFLPRSTRSRFYLAPLFRFEAFTLTSIHFDSPFTRASHRKESEANWMVKKRGRVSQRNEAYVLLSRHEE